MSITHLQRLIARAKYQDGGLCYTELANLSQLRGERIEELEKLIGDRRQAELCKGATWGCPYCGEATCDRSSAAMHPSLCKKWPYRLEAERLRAVFVDQGANLAVKLGRIAHSGVESDGQMRHDIGLLLIEAVREASGAVQPEHTEGES